MFYKGGRVLCIKPHFPNGLSDWELPPNKTYTVENSQYNIYSSLSLIDAPMNGGYTPSRFVHANLKTLLTYRLLSCEE